METHFETGIFQSGVPVYLNRALRRYKLPSRSGGQSTPVLGGSWTKQQQENQSFKSGLLSARLGVQSRNRPPHPIRPRSMISGIFWLPSGCGIMAGDFARLLEYRYVALAPVSHWVRPRNVTFRWEVYNALNHQNLGIPNPELLLAAECQRDDGSIAPVRLPVWKDYERADRPARHHGLA